MPKQTFYKSSPHMPNPPKRRFSHFLYNRYCPTFSPMHWFSILSCLICSLIQHNILFCHIELILLLAPFMRMLMPKRYISGLKEKLEMSSSLLIRGFTRWWIFFLLSFRKSSNSHALNKWYWWVNNTNNKV